MRILFTGATSFTGMWFTRRLTTAGHDVVATATRKDRAAYPGLRGRRLESLPPDLTVVFGCSFGDEAFLNLITGSERWDVLCHHAAVVTDHKSPTFDVAGALAANSYRAREVLAALASRGCKAVVLTGSYYEPDEGGGEGSSEAFSPYGLSKKLTWETFRYWCSLSGMTLGKFVLPNPVGALEEPRFAAHMIKAWREGTVPVLQTPAYIRDNAPVSLLADAYEQFIGQAVCAPAASRLRLTPSGWVETVGEFVRRLATGLGPRLGVECRWEESHGLLSEPKERRNSHSLLRGWSPEQEAQFWDSWAAYYQ